jgi:TolA-binding protein
MDQAIAAYRSGEYGTAAKLFAARAAQGDALADLWLARTARQTQGCGAAAKKFDAVTSRHAGTHVAHDATLEAAHCYRAIGEENAAQQRFASLVNVQSHADRARNALHPGGSKAAPRSTGTPAPATPPSKR